MPNAIGTSAIGPSFGSELIAAGLGGIALGWGADGALSWGPDVTDAQKASVEAVFASHDPTKGTVPDVVPMWAAQAALKAAGKYDAVNSAILGMETSNPLVFFAWTMGNFASRRSEFISALASNFTMSSADIDAIFVAADQIARVAS